MKPADGRPGTQSARRLRRTLRKLALCVLRRCAAQPALTHGAHVFLVATRTVAGACAEKKRSFPLVRQAARTRELLLIRTPLLLALCAPACGAWLAIGAALPVTALSALSVFTKNHTAPHTQVTRADHTIKACLGGITDRSLARLAQ